MAKFYISDNHFLHENVILFDKRPYDSVKQMTYAMVDKWNKTVTKNDDVYIVGDFSLGDSKETSKILKKLNGNKHLIKGNHEGKWLNGENKMLFNEVVDYKEVKDGDYKVILSHYPIVLHRGHRYDNFIHLFGHVHTSAEEIEVRRQILSAIKNTRSKGQCYNVGSMLEYMNFTPRTLEEIIEGGKKRWQKIDEILKEKENEKNT